MFVWSSPPVGLGLGLGLTCPPSGLARFGGFGTVAEGWAAAGDASAARHFSRSASYRNRKTNAREGDGIQSTFVLTWSTPSTVTMSASPDRATTAAGSAMRHLATSISDVMYNAACVGGCASSFTSSSTARVRRIVAGKCDMSLDSPTVCVPCTCSSHTRRRWKRATSTSPSSSAPPPTRAPALSNNSGIVGSGGGGGGSGTM
mmetsp:Transcript_10599/g.42765  ORF Transcript_10599/g.42765 Transcript_10599/m.42765 type:complete len:203 (+) Transcript_10599:495-1103(+)